MHDSLVNSVACQVVINLEDGPTKSSACIVRWGIYLLQASLSSTSYASESN